MKATYRPRKVIIHGAPMELQPGQFIFGRNTAAETMKMKPSTVRDSFERLRALECITIQPSRSHSLVTVLNWGVYQGDDTGPDAVLPTAKQPHNNDRFDDNQQATVTDNPTTTSSRFSSLVRQVGRHAPDTNKKVRSVKDTVKRGVAASGNELLSLEFVLRLTGDEFNIFLQQASKVIAVENPRFAWDSATGGFESDMRKLIYKITDARKVLILSDAFKILGEKSNWAAYVLMGIKYTVRSTRKSRVNSAYLYTTSMLTKPALLAGSIFDGKMQGATWQNRKR